MNFSEFSARAVARLRGYSGRALRFSSATPKRLFSRSLASLLALRNGMGSAPAGARHRQKPHLLILRNRHYASNSAQVSTEQIHLDQTLQACGLATFEVLTYDADLGTWPRVDLQLFRACQARRPDAIVLSSWWDTPRQPSVHVLGLIRRLFGIRLGVIWWDTCSSAFWRAARPYRDLFDVHVVLDNPMLHFADQDDVFRDKILKLWPPQDEGLYHPRGVKDIPVSFMGQVSAYRSYRREAIEHLVAQGVPGKFYTNDRGQQVTHAVYADVMGRSAMSINFSYSVDCHQLKSRVFEILFSEALLLESENEQTAAMFEPMKDYVPFNSKLDLEQKIAYYAAHEEERVRIARQGRKTAMEKYRSSEFWRLFLARLMNDQGH